MPFLLLSLLLSPSFGIEQSPHAQAFCKALLQTKPVATQNSADVLESLKPEILSALEKVSEGPKTREQKILLFLNAIRPETLAQIYEEWRKGHFDLLENYDQTVLSSIQSITKFDWTPTNQKKSAAILARLSQLRADIYSEDSKVEAFEVRGKNKILNYLDNLEATAKSNDKSESPPPFPKKSTLLKGALTVAVSAYIYSHGIGFLIEPLPHHLGLVIGGIIVSLKALVAAILYYLGRVIVYPQLKETLHSWSGLVSSHGRIRYEEMTSQDHTSSQLHMIAQMRKMVSEGTDHSGLIYNSLNLISADEEKIDPGSYPYFLSDQILFFDQREPVLINFLRTKNKILSPK